MARTRILVVDPDHGEAERVRYALADQVVEVSSAPTWPDALQLLTVARARGGPFDLVLLLAELLGEEKKPLAALRARALQPHLMVLARDPEDELGELDVHDVVVKPVSRGEILARLEQAPGARDPRAVRRPRKSDLIVGGGRWLKDLYDKMSMAAPTNVTISISGESGTGKELVARTIHALSSRHTAPFVVVNCAAIPEPLLEDELFGHVRGAFTDAGRDREGLFAAADGGTIFLDEIGELPLQLQSKLLRVLQSQEFRRIGDDEPRQVDVRVIAATNIDLEAAVAQGRFREDLFYRINVFPLHLPPLRDRSEDVPLLAHHFLRLHRASLDKSVKGFAPEAMRRLSSYEFPGNVRELDNRIHRALVMARGEEITLDDLDLTGAVRDEPRSIDLSRPFKELKQEAVARFERAYLDRLLTQHGGNLAAAARAAGIDRKNLWSMAKKRGVDLDRFRQGE